MSILNHELPNYRIAVVGAGAIGCFYGGRLAQFGRDVHFLMRSDYDVVKKRGLRIRSRQGDVHIPNAKVHRTAEAIGPCDVVLIALKATANPALLDLLPPLLKDNTLLVTLQNGLGNEAFLATHFGAERVLGCLCFVALNRTAPGEIHHIAQGQLTLGEYQRWPLPRTHELASEFKRCGIVCSVEGRLDFARWKKLVWNTAFNGWSIAAGGLDTAALLADDDLKTLIREQMREVILTAQKLGHPLPTSLADTMLERTLTIPPYRPSSLIDFEAGREVELEAIWGEPLQTAHRAGIDMPRLHALYHLLRHQIQNRSSPSS